MQEGLIYGIIALMHKDFYASGFLYHPKTQQILLQQVISANIEPIWSMLGGENLKNETSEASFGRIIYKVLRIKIKPNNIFPVYTYFHSEKNIDHFICYAKITKLEKFPNSKKSLFSWFTFKQIQKMNLPAQIKQDIIVGQRVIQSSIRKGLGERTIE